MCSVGTNKMEGNKCIRPGRMTGNGYLNFLREFRKKHCGLSAVEVVVKGAKAWSKLSCDEKAAYKLMACQYMSRKTKVSRRRQRSNSRASRRASKPQRKRRSQRRRSNDCKPKRRRRRMTC